MTLATDGLVCALPDRSSQEEIRAQLQGKIDTIPGQTNETWIEADQPGTYRGQCAEFCGLQHANMALDVMADAPDTLSP